MMDCILSNVEEHVHFYLVLLIGTPIAILGIIMNSLLMLILQKRSHVNSPRLYFGVLSLLDLLICLTYVLLFPPSVITDHCHPGQVGALLVVAWHNYVVTLLFLSKVVQTMSTMLVVCATIERYIVVSEIKRWQIEVRCRKLIIWLVLLFVLAFRMSSYWDITVKTLPKCERNLGYITNDSINTPFETSAEGDALNALPENTINIDLTNCSSHPPFDTYLVENNVAIREPYNTIYNIYLLQTVQLFIPFTLLIILNVFIILKVRKSMKDCEPSEQEYDDPMEILRKHKKYLETKARLKSATNTTVALVTSYLLCASLDVPLRIGEFVTDIENIPQRRIASDLVSLLFMVNSVLRLPIYWKCNLEIGGDIESMVCSTSTPYKIKTYEGRRYAIVDGQYIQLHTAILSAQYRAINQPEMLI